MLFYIRDNFKKLLKVTDINLITTDELVGRLSKRGGRWPPANILLSRSNKVDENLRSVNLFAIPTHFAANYDEQCFCLAHVSRRIEHVQREGGSHLACVVSSTLWRSSAAQPLFYCDCQHSYQYGLIARLKINASSTFNVLPLLKRDREMDLMRKGHFSDLLFKTSAHWNVRWLEQKRVFNKMFGEGVITVTLINSSLID